MVRYIANHQSRINNLLALPAVFFYMVRELELWIDGPVIVVKNAECQQPTGPRPCVFFDVVIADR
jgi:hypothetical protein